MNLSKHTQLVIKVITENMLMLFSSEQFKIMHDVINGIDVFTVQLSTKFYHGKQQLSINDIATIEIQPAGIPAVTFLFNDVTELFALDFVRCLQGAVDTLKILSASRFENPIILDDFVVLNFFEITVKYKDGDVVQTFMKTNDTFVSFTSEDPDKYTEVTLDKIADALRLVYAYDAGDINFSNSVTLIQYVNPERYLDDYVWTEEDE